MFMSSFCAMVALETRLERRWLETNCPSILEMKGKLEVGCRFFNWDLNQVPPPPILG